MADLTLDDFEPLISSDELSNRVAELGRQITRDLGDSHDLVVVGVLKGALVFMADLIRHLPHSATCDFLRLSSYAGTQSTGKVRFDFDMTQPIEGKDVLIVEDIVDTGNSMSFLLPTLLNRKPRSLHLCTLLDKPSRRQCEVPIEYCGFTIPDQFVIGYGLDLEGRYRSLPAIHALKTDIEDALTSSEDSIH